ncbi:hypothetical protein RGUI_2986 [Rhodovulum sp. P5]|nr:hypothetical protein RGUI_2986 [Rhodovulum sp. P5]
MQRWYRPVRNFRNAMIFAGVMLALAETGLGALPGMILVLLGVSGLASSLWFAFAPHQLPAQHETALTREAGRWALLCVVALAAGVPLALIA